jgi:hypothetical protein
MEKDKDPVEIQKLIRQRQQVNRAYRDAHKHKTSKHVRKLIAKDVRETMEFNSEEMIRFIAKNGFFWRLIFAWRILFNNPRNGKYFNKVEN